MPRNNSSLTSTLRTLCGAAIDPSLSDRELTARFVQQHDQAAFTALVRRHASIVYNVCRRVLDQHADIEDAVQATFVLLSRKAGSLKHPELVGAWLHAVARKVALKARDRKPSDCSIPLNPEEPHSRDPLDVLSGREVLAILDEEMDRLPEEYRAVLLLCCIEGKSREEAAQRLGWSAGSVKGRLERGRDLLSRRLSRRGLTLSAALGAALVRQTTTANAAGPTIAAVLDSAPPQAVALANAVAGSLDAGIRIKWGLVAVLLLTGAGVGTGFWGDSYAEPLPRSQPQRTAPPNRIAGEQAVSEVDPPPTPPLADPPPKIGASVSGLLREVDPEFRRVTLRVREVDRAYRLTDGVDIRIDGKAAAIADLAALTGRPRVRITLDSKGTEVVSLLAEGETVIGTLQGVNSERHTITLRRSVTDLKAAAVTWPLSSEATITLDGKPATLAEIREGNRGFVRLSADGKHVLALDAKSP